MAKSKQREQELNEQTLQQVEAQQTQAEQEEQEEEDDSPEKLSRTESAWRVIADIDGDTTLSELGEKADALYRASRPDAEEDTDTAEWHVQKQLEVLEGIGLVELRWECVIHPNVPKIGLKK